MYYLEYIPFASVAPCNRSLQVATLGLSNSLPEPSSGLRVQALVPIVRTDIVRFFPEVFWRFYLHHEDNKDEENHSVETMLLGHCDRPCIGLDQLADLAFFLRRQEMGRAHARLNQANCCAVIGRNFSNGKCSLAHKIEAS
jgi:hypothetical protein